MKHFNFLFLLILFSHCLVAQKLNSKVKVFEEYGKFGVASGKKTIIPPTFKEIRFEENGLIAVKDTVGLWGYFDTKGRPIIQPRFIEALPFKTERALVKKEDGWGIIDRQGNFIIKPLYKSIDEKEAGIFEALPFQEIIVFNSKKDTISSILTDSVVNISKDIYAYFLDGKSGLLDKSGNKITLPIYDSIGLFQNKAVVVKKDNKWGVLDEYGKEIIPTYFSNALIDSTGFLRASHQEDGVEKWFLFNSKGKAIGDSYHFIGEINKNMIFVFKSDGKYGIMDTAAHLVIKPEYQSIAKVKEGFLIKSEEGFGLASNKGKWLYQPYADSLSVLQEKYVLYKSQNNYHLLDSTGWEKACSTSPLFPLKNGLIEIRNKGKFGRVNFKGEEILAPVYDSIGTLTNDNALVVIKDKKIGLYNLTRDTLIGPNDRIQEIHPESEGFYGVKINGKYGFVDNLARIRIANRYQGVGKFNEGYAPVKLLGKWGFIDKAEVLRVQPSFDEVEDFKNGLAIVRKDGKYGLINKKGQIVTAINYDGFERTDQNFFVSRKNIRNHEQKGLINPEGRELIFAKYDDLTPVADGNVIIKKNNRFGVVNTNDLILFSIIYRSIEYDEHQDNYIMTREKPKETINLGIK